MTRRKQESLISDAEAASRTLRITAIVIEAIAALSLLLLIVFLVDDEYGWPLFTGLVLSLLVTVLLAGRVTRARAIALEIAASRLEMAIEARGGNRGSEGDDRDSG